MMKLEPGQMEALRQAFRAQCPERLLEGLRQQGEEVATEDGRSAGAPARG